MNEKIVARYRLRGGSDIVWTLVLTGIFGWIVTSTLPVAGTEVEILRESTRIASERTRHIRLMRAHDAVEAEIAIREQAVDVERWARETRGMVTATAADRVRVEVDDE